MKFEEFDAKEEDEEFQKFLQEATTKKSESKNEQKEFERIAITPEPAFCLKTKTIATSNENTGEKVFINVCTSTKIQAPRDISEHELIEIVKSEDPGRYRVPISLGEPVADIDKNGHGCSIFTVIIHPDYLKKARQSSTFMNFLLTLVYEGLENKFPMFKLETDWIKLKNRKYMGQLTDQYIRTKSKPFIVEIDSNGKSELDEQDKLETIKDKNQFENENDIETKLQRGQIPEYKITREPLEGEPEYLVMEVQLPKVKSSKTISLDIGEDRILLQTRSNVYFLDIYLSFNMNSDDCGAQFDKATQILTITIPLETSK